MKKKFINGLLMAALFGGFTGSMVSCKDYDDEKVVNLEAIMNQKTTTLQQALDAQKAALEAEIKNLQTQLTNCQTTCEAFRTSVNEKFAQYLEISAFNTFKDNLGNIYYTKEEVNQKFYTKEEMDTKFTNYYTKAEIDALLDNLSKQLDAYLKTEALAFTIDSLLRANDATLTNALNTWFVNNPVVENYLKDGKGSTIINQLIAEALVSVNDSIRDVAATANQALELAKKNETNIANLVATTTDHGNRLTTVEGKVVTLEGQVTDLNGKVIVIDGKVVDLEKRMAAAEGRIDSLKTEVSGLDTKLTDLTTQHGLLKTQVEQLQGQVNTLDQTVIKLQGDVEQAAAVAAEAKAAAEANELRINTLEAIYLQLESFYSDLNLKVDGMGEEIDALQVLMANANSDIQKLTEQVAADRAAAEKLHKEMLETISGLVSSCETIGELVALLAIDMSDLQDRVDNVAADVAANTAAIDKLQGVFNNILAQWITGITLNGSYCPMFGEFSLPFGQRSNMLIAFKGTIDEKGLEFPTYDDLYFSQPDADHLNAFTEADADILGGLDEDNIPGYISLMPGRARTIVAKDGAEGNAGTLYLTINPTTRDFDGVELSIINSRNEASAITLNDTKKSDHLLYFGYTRAEDQTGNGLYAALATLKVEDVNKVAPFNFDASGIKDLLLDLKNRKDAFNVTRAANVIYNNLHEILPASAVKAYWTDSTGIQKSVVSQYDIAATAVKPLSFSFAKDLKFNHLPGLGRAENFVERLIDKVVTGFPDINPYDITVDSIVLDDLTNELKATFHMYVKNNHLISQGPRTVWYDMPEWTCYGEDGEIVTIRPADPSVKITIDENDYAEIIITYDISDELFHASNYYTEGQTNVKAEIQEYLDDLNKFLNKLQDITIDNIAEKISDKLFSFIDTHTQKFVRFMTPNKYLQPVLLIQDKDGFSRLSESAKVPARVKLAGQSYISLCPTTYNAEIITPAYKKFVAVTNVRKGSVSAKGGDQTCLQILKGANQTPGICAVIDGGSDLSKSLKLPVQAGYIYEIVYSAVDYSGKVVSRKYYLRVNE